MADRSPSKPLSQALETAGCCAAGVCCWLGRDRRPLLKKGGSSVHLEVQQRILARSGKSEPKLHIGALLLISDPTRKVSQHYRTIEMLGAGAFGTVSRVEDIASREERAIKTIQKSEMESDMEYIHNELESMLKLDHPNIVRLYEFFEDDHRLYLVTELCTHGDFSDLDLQTHDEDEVRILFRDIMMAVAYCHDLGIVHRDLKYENCLIDKQRGQRQVGKVIDFGLAAIVNEGSIESLNDQLGTRYFVAPEVIDNRIKYGAKCDCWSIGVMVYICLTDEHPMAEDASELSTPDLFRKILNRRIRERPLDDANVKPEGRDFVIKLLVKDAAKRMSSQQALDHDWLQPWKSGKKKNASAWASESYVKDHRRSKSDPIQGDEELVARVRGFGKYTKFEKAVMTLVAHHARSQEVEDLRAAFMKIDTSRTGTLSKEEVHTALAKHSKVSDEDIDQIFNSMDADGSGRIHYTEWLTATMRPDKLASDKAMEQIYRFFDLEQDGVVSREELLRVLGDNEAVSSVLEQSGVADDAAHISKDQFKRLLAKVATSLNDGQMPRRFTL